jgi:hypothetical protein
MSLQEKPDGPDCDQQDDEVGDSEEPWLQQRNGSLVAVLDHACCGGR